MRTPPTVFEVLGRRHDGYLVDRPVTEQFRSYPQSEGGLTCSRRCDRQKVTRTAGKVLGQCTALPCTKGTGRGARLGSRGLSSGGFGRIAELGCHGLRRHRPRLHWNRTVVSRSSNFHQCPATSLAAATDESRTRSAYSWPFSLRPARFRFSRILPTCTRIVSEMCDTSAPWLGNRVCRQGCWRHHE